MDGKVEEVSEESLRHALAGTYIDVDTVVRAIDGGEQIVTPSALYYSRGVLTRLEKKMMDVLGELIYAEYGFSDVEITDVAEKMEESVNVVRVVCLIPIRKRKREKRLITNCF